MLASLDPLSLMFTNGLLTLVVAAVLWVSCIGLREAGQGVGWWIAGDVTLSLARWLFLAELPRGADVSAVPILALPGMLWMLGMFWHLEALRHAAGRRTSPAALLAQALAVLGLFGAPALLLDTLGQRAIWLYCLMTAASAITLRALWPMRKFWGARLIGAMMVLVMVFLPFRILSLLLTSVAEGTDSANANLLRAQAAWAPMLLDMVISLSLSTGFLLLLQERLRERVERLVITDALTGALNRHGLMPMLTREIAAAQRHRRPLSLVLFDLDHFKLVNDRHGHAVGDSVLTGFATRVQSLVRRSDLFGRWGGEEFLLVLPDTPLDVALAAAERIRAQVSARPVAGDAPLVTVSGGVASTGETPEGPLDLTALLDRADQRMYLAKRQRNLVLAAH